MSSLPKKSLGQHWLHDNTALRAMAAAADVGAGDVVLEIGPGTGTLTQILLDVGANVIAVEADESLIDDLTHIFTGRNFSILHEDILRFDFGQLEPGYKVVANIPYYITSNLLRVLCENNNPFSTAALLVQKEVAERVAAEQGQMSVLAVSVQFYCEVALGQVVPAALFTPPPKVDSQILILTRRAQPLFEDVNTRQFFQIVKAGFSGRRKTLENSLAGGLHCSKQEAREYLEEAVIQPGLRAQALTLQEWYELYRVISSYDKALHVNS